MQILQFFFYLLLSNSLFSQPQGWRYKEEIDSLFFKNIKTTEPGYGIVIVKNKEIIYNNCIGLSNVKRKIPITNNTIFGLASVSKQFTAMCILLLQEQGKIDIYDKIHEYIPELPNYGQDITLHHLLNHTSGIRDHIEVMVWLKQLNRKNYPFDGMLKYFSKFKSLSFKPGSQFAYSNTGYMLLALVVERVSGLSFQDFAKKHIFEPLGMDDTEFSFFRKKRAYNYSMSYDWKKNKFKKAYWKEVNATGATGVYTTLNDLIKWDKNFYNNKLGNGKSSIIEQMNTSGSLNNGASIHYGNGQIIKKEQGVKIYKHAGGWNNFRFQYTRIPELELSIIIATNSNLYKPNAMANKLVGLIVSNPSNKNWHGLVVKKDYQPIEGIYISENFTMRSLKYENQHLNISGPGLFRSKVVTIKEINNSCFIDSIENEICFDDQFNKFTWQGGMYFMVNREFTKIDSAGSIPLANFEGIYQNKELGKLNIKFLQEKNKLRIISGIGAKTTLSQLASNIFENENYQFSLWFHDDHLYLGNNRVYNFKFKKLDP